MKWKIHFATYHFVTCYIVPLTTCHNSEYISQLEVARIIENACVGKWSETCYYHMNTYTCMYECGT